MIFRDRSDISLLRDLLAASDRILITTHRHPDGDAVGALLAFSRALHAAGKTVTPHTPDAPPAFLRFLPGCTDIVQNLPPAFAYDLVIAVDHSDLRRTGLEDELLERRIPVVAIDHHATADRRGSVVLVEPEAAATCEMLVALFPLLRLTMDHATATCLLTGLVTDTGSFQHPNTSAGILAAAGLLLEAGADLRTITANVYGARSLAALRILGRALERLEVNQETGAVISAVTNADLKECGASESDLAGIANLLNTIPEASFSLLLTEYEEGKLKGSLRSKPRRIPVNVAAIARRLGGGGHDLASGFEAAGRLVRDATGWRIE